MMRLRLELEVRRPDGSIRYKEMQDVNSWVKNAANLFVVAFRAADLSLQFTNTSGAGPKSLDLSGTTTNIWGMGDTFSIGNEGIIVGTGTTAADKDDFDLETKIAEGSGSGQFTHGTMINYEGVLGTPTGFTNLIERTFQNDSGGTITINEVGLRNRWDTNLGAGATNETFLLVRDVLAAGVVVLDSEAVVVRYFFDWDV